MENLEVIVIAGGEGSRFESDVPKHLVEIAGEPLVKLLAKRISKYTNKFKSGMLYGRSVCLPA